MKSIFKYLLIVSLGVILFSSCEETDIKLSENIVGFRTTSGRIGEATSTPLAIPVYNSASSGSATVSFTFSTEDINNPAIEGTDFTVVNSSNTLTFANSYATDTIFIQPIDNGAFEGNKQVIVELGEPTGGFVLTNEDTYSVTIVDDEHPLATWIGTYTVDAASNLQPGTWDEVWSAKLEPIDGVIDQLTITGIANSTVPVTATFDTGNMTITVEAGTDIGDPYDWAPTGIYGYDPVGGSLIASGPIEGTISNDGTIVFPYMILAYTGNPAANVWDIFTPTFNKD